jgi:hypothetical protein
LLSQTSMFWLQSCIQKKSCCRVHPWSCSYPYETEKGWWLDGGIHCSFNPMNSKGGSGCTPLRYLTLAISTRYYYYYSSWVITGNGGGFSLTPLCYKCLNTQSHS